MVHGSIAAAGLASDFGLHAIAKVPNRLSVQTSKARLGKNKMFNALKDDQNRLKEVVDILEDNPKTRTRVCELADGLNSDDVIKLKNDSKLLKRLLNDGSFYEFNKNARDLQRYAHIFEGDSGGGWHYYPTGKNKDGNEILEITRSNQNTGVYDARVLVNGNEKMSTFFPDYWSEREVLEAINDGFEQRKFNNEFGEWVATVRSIEIRLNIDQNGKLISAFPNGRNNF